MRRTEVYQVRLDLHEKKQAFAVFKQLGISPAQAIRLFFRQVILTRSIPFPIEQGQVDSAPNTANQPTTLPTQPTADKDVFDQLDELLKNSTD